MPFTKKLRLGIVLFFLVSIPFLVAQDQSDDTVGTDVFSVATQGGDPGPGPGPGVFIPPGGPGPGPSSGNNIPTINLGRIFGKSSNDPCKGHFVEVTQRQYFEMAAHPNQWLCAENGYSPGIHRLCADLTKLPGSCYDPNHQPPFIQRVVQNCLDFRTQCGQLLHKENCADIFRLQAELASGVQFPQPQLPAQYPQTLEHWTPLYLARSLPDLVRQCQAQGFTPRKQQQTPPCAPINDATWPPWQALNNALRLMATNTGQGIAAVRTAYTNLGLGYLLASSAFQIQSAGGKASNQLWSWAAQAGAVSQWVKTVPPPPGFQASQVVLSRPRPVIPQEHAMSCGPACVRMTAATVLRLNQPIAETAVQWLCNFDPNVGTYLQNARFALLKLGINTTLTDKGTLNELIQYTSTGYPAIVNMYGPKVGHAIIVDGVAKDANGRTYVYGRDPVNRNLLDPQAHAQMLSTHFSPYPIMTVEDFLGPMGWTRQALYTHP